MLELDGNAIAGALADVFGSEMTTAIGTCAGCQAVAALAETSVYLHGADAIARCRSCGSVLIVLVQVRGVTCVDLGGLAGLDN